MDQGGKKTTIKTRAAASRLYTLVFLVAFCSARAKGDGADCDVGKIIQSKDASL
jgi:hypothetical protein